MGYVDMKWAEVEAFANSVDEAYWVQVDLDNLMMIFGQ